jgi:iron complex transport system substrate-binding protein
MKSLLLAALCALSLGSQAAPLRVNDDDGRPIELAQPARRIISLAPHTTELLYAIGAGDRIVATVNYADYPEAAKKLPRVGDAHLLDLERIAALKPDLIVVWMHGSAAQQIERLRALGLPVFHSESHRLEDIADGMRRLGVLTGTTTSAQAAASAYERELAALKQQYGGRKPVRVFYQVWHEPLLSLNDRHLISDAIRLCGGLNVFGTQGAMVPTVSVEAVLAAKPDLVATTQRMGTQSEDGLDRWRSLKHFEPGAKGRFVILDSDLISRQTPRILQGTRTLCEGFEQVRKALPR